MNDKYFTLESEDAQNRPFVPLILSLSDRTAAVIGRKEAQKTSKSSSISNSRAGYLSFCSVENL